jgi:hypothetical protein
MVMLWACTQNAGSSSTSGIQPSVLVSQISSHCTDLAAPDLGDGTLCIDNGFRVSSDNFSFTNWGRSVRADANVTVQTLIDLFGHSAVCLDGPEDKCTLRPTTTQKLEEWNNALAGGRCEGLAALSTRFFLKLDDPRSFNSQAVKVADLRQDNNSLESAIVYWWATQFLTEVSDRAATSRSNSPLQIVDDLVQGLANGVGYTLGLYYQSSGHAVTPFAVTHRNNTFVIHAYDNNFPGIRKEIIVDGSTNTWTYPDARAQLDGQQTAWSGNTGTLELTPMSSRKGPFTCPFCSTLPTKANSIITVASRDSSAPGFVLVTTRDGKNIEATPDGITNTIPGATYEMSKGTKTGLLTIRMPSSISDFNIEIRRVSPVIPAADVVVSVQRPTMPSIQVTGNLAHTVVGAAPTSTPLLKIRSDYTSITAPKNNSLRVSIAAGTQLSRSEITSSRTLLVKKITQDSIEIALKGARGEEIATTSLEATNSTSVTEATFYLDENNTIVSTTSKVDAVPVERQLHNNSVPRLLTPSTTTTAVTSIEISAPD